MDFASNQQPQIDEMLKAIGISSIDELFADIPAKLKQPAPKKDGLSEYEGIRLMETLSHKNTYCQYDNYLGAGAYEHHIPAIVNSICSKAEFLTAYTPYQAEISQGMLQAIFEFQSAICALTGMDVANASVYDGASACAESILMALRQQNPREKIVIAHSLNPLYRKVVDQYLATHSSPIHICPSLPNGTLDLNTLQNLLDDQTAAILIQSPNFFGTIEDVKQIAHMAKQKGILTILCANPLAYGLFQSATELGVDIAIGDTQPFGLSMHFGGPYVGYMACRKELVRQLPGRIVGETVDTQGRRGFVLTLQAREQHIRREKATSNICTNQALAALASLIAILWYGKNGVHDLALTNYQHTAYLRQQLAKIPGISVPNTPEHFNEFVITVDADLTALMHHCRQNQIEPGLDLSRFFPNLKNHLLVCVTETKSKEQLDRYVNAVHHFMEQNYETK